MSEPVPPIALPAPVLSGTLSVEAAIATRRSVRRYARGGLELAQLGQLLWAAQGITDASRGFRTAPSAGARYPLHVAAVVRDVGDLAAGVYDYEPAGHALVLRSRGSSEEELSSAALQDPSVRSAPVTLVFWAATGRGSATYGERGVRDIMLDLGHAAQNVYLEAAALGLGVVAVGAFDSDAVGRVVGLEGTQEALYLVPAGVPS